MKQSLHLNWDPQSEGPCCQQPWVGSVCTHSKKSTLLYHQPAQNSLAAPCTTQRKGRVFYRLLTQNWWYWRRTLKKDDTQDVQVLHQDCLMVGGSSSPWHRARTGPCTRICWSRLGTSVSQEIPSWRGQKNQKASQRNGNCCPDLSNSNSGSSELKGRVLATFFPINSYTYFFKWTSSSLSSFTCSSICVFIYIYLNICYFVQN